MGEGPDLTRASRAELIAYIGELRASLAELVGQVAQLQARVRELEGRGGSGPKGMPGHKPAAATRPADKPREPRRKRAHNVARRRQEPTEQVIHAVDTCPECQTRLLGGWVQRRREVIEIPEIPPVRVIEHVYVARQCPVCERRRVPAPELDGVVVGRSRLGVNLTSLIVTLREGARLPFHKIRWFLETFYRLPLSVGGLVGAVQAAARRVGPAVEAVRDRVRASPVVNGDETGWRENGQNRYVWSFSTPTDRYFLFGRRTKDMVDAGLGPDFDGVLVADFYAAYDHYEGEIQRCWVHLLRDIHALKQQHPADAAVWAWARAVHRLFKLARAFSSPDQAERWAAQERCERALLRLCARGYHDPAAPHHTLCARIFKHIKALFVFVADPRVPADNNGAERSLRDLVVCRKISGGTRSPEGTSTKLALASLFGSWQAQGLNPFPLLRSTLISPLS